MNVCYACSQLTFDTLKILTIFHTPMPTNVVHTVDTGYLFLFRHWDYWNPQPCISPIGKQDGYRTGFQLPVHCS